MHTNLYRTSIILIILVVFSACDSQKTDCGLSKLSQNEKLHLDSENLTKDLIEISNIEQGLKFINNNPFISEYFFNPTRQLKDSAIAELMVDVFTHPSYRDTLYQQVNNTFGNFNTISEQFSDAFSLYKHYYPQVKEPKLKYVLSGLQTDLFISDTLIAVAADYYLGSEARYVPLGLPQYMLRRYQKEYIVPMTMLIVTQNENVTDPSNTTLLADMIFYGKSYYMTKQMMPCTPDSLFLGYTAQEVEDINKNEHIIWANFLENDLLYESSHFIKNKFIGERPKTFEISNNCPGRIGLWVGWQIVKSYMENNPEVTLQELMSTVDVNLIFSKAKYKPKP